MIREISLYSLNSRYGHINPIEKISLIFISLVFCGYTENIYIILTNIILFCVLNFVAENPLKVVKKFLYIVGTFSLFTSLTLLWQGYGLGYIATLLLRGINGSLTIAFLSLTTPINHIVFLMNKSEYLKELADIMKSMERFLILIGDDFDTSFKAMKSRVGFNGFKKSISDFGKVCGLTFKNLMMRWQEINLGLKNRCYRGKHNYNYSFEFSKVRVIGIIFYLAIMISLTLV